MFPSDGSIQRVIISDEETLIEFTDTKSALNNVEFVPTCTVATLTQEGCGRMEFAPHTTLEVTLLDEGTKPMLIMALKYEIIFPVGKINPLNPVDVRLFVGANPNTSQACPATFVIHRLGAPPETKEPDVKTQEEAHAEQVRAEEENREYTGVMQQGNYLIMHTMVDGYQNGTLRVLDRVVVNTTLMVPLQGTHVAFLMPPRQCPSAAGFYANTIMRHSNRPLREVLQQELVQLDTINGTKLSPYNVPLANDETHLFRAIQEQLFNGSNPPVMLSFEGNPKQDDKRWTLTFAHVDSGTPPLEVAVAVEGDGLPTANPLGTDTLVVKVRCPRTGKKAVRAPVVMCTRTMFMSYGASGDAPLTYVANDVSWTTTVVDERPLLALANGLTVAEGSRAFLYDHSGQNPREGYHKPRADGHFHLPDRGHGGTDTGLGIAFLDKQFKALSDGQAASLILLSDCAIPMATIDALTVVGGHFDTWTKNTNVDVYFVYSGPYVNRRSEMQAKLNAWQGRVHLIYIDHTLQGPAFTQEIERAVAAVQGEQPRIHITLGQGTHVVTQRDRVIEGVHGTYLVASGQLVEIFSTKADTIVHVAVSPDGSDENRTEYPPLSRQTLTLESLSHSERLAALISLARQAHHLWEKDGAFKTQLQEVLVREGVVVAGLTQQSELGGELHGVRPDRALCERKPLFTPEPWALQTLSGNAGPFGTGPQPVWRSLPQGPGAIAAAAYGSAVAPPVYRSQRVVRPAGAMGTFRSAPATGMYGQPVGAPAMPPGGGAPAENTSNSVIVFMNLNAFSTKNVDPLGFGRSTRPAQVTLQKMKIIHFLLSQVPYYIGTLRRESNTRGLNDTVGLYKEFVVLIKALWWLNKIDLDRLWHGLEKEAYHDPHFQTTREAASN